MSLAWVIGGGGLLGTALRAACHAEGMDLYSAQNGLCWDDETALNLALMAAVRGFSAAVADGKPWQIFWAAGIGTMASNAAELEPETRALAHLLALIAQESALRDSTCGVIALASSAGALYAASTDYVISELSEVTSSTAYAHAKLAQESLVHQFSRRCPAVSVVISRITTLYGPGQAAGKRQGLIAHIARSVLRNRPVQIFVPFDTIRDYIASADAAQAMLAYVSAVQDATGTYMHIVAGEQPTTIAEIISTFRRIARRAPLVVTSASPLSKVYLRRVQYRSLQPVDPGRPRTSLLVGIAQVMEAERRLYIKAARTWG